MTALWLNGLPWKPYEYGGTGTDTLTPPDLAAELDEAERRETEELRRGIAARLAARNGRAPLYPCGTTAAYQRHMRHGEQPCEACREASKQEQRRRKGALAS